MEQALVFDVSGQPLLGVLHPGQAEANVGVLILVGGPQYRVGSHRQFLLLARTLAAQGIPVLRFDYRGMGDSGGDQCDFEQVDEDLKAALRAFVAAAPELNEIIIWGLCDAASAALLFAWRHPSVSGLVLLNPWVRTDEGLAKVYLKHYYLRRILDWGFWRDLARGRLDFSASARSLWQTLATIASNNRHQITASATTTPIMEPSQPLPLRMAKGWRQFRGRILVILSGDDLTAAEFRDTAESTKDWTGLLNQSRVTIKELTQANHTFSRREWREQVEQWTVEWIKEQWP